MSTPAKGDDPIAGLGSRRGVARLAPKVDWSTLDLDDIHGFVLSRVDGRTTLGDICLLSPFPEAQTVQVLRSLHGRGVIEIPGVPRQPAAAPASATKTAVTMPGRPVGEVAPPGSAPPPSPPKQEQPAPSRQSQASSPQKPPQASPPKQPQASPQKPQQAAPPTQQAAPPRAQPRPAQQAASSSLRATIPAAPPGTDKSRLAYARTMGPGEMPLPEAPPPAAPKTAAPPTQPAKSPEPPPARTAMPEKTLVPRGVIAPPPPPAVAAPAAEEIIQLSIEERASIDAMLALVERSAPPEEILGVPPGTSAKDLKRTYFRLSKEFHPDRFFKRQLGPYKRHLQLVFNALKSSFDALSDGNRGRSGS